MEAGQKAAVAVQARDDKGHEFMGLRVTNNSQDQALAHKTNTTVG